MSRSWRRENARVVELAQQVDQWRRAWGSRPAVGSSITRMSGAMDSTVGNCRGALLAAGQADTRRGAQVRRSRRGSRACATRRATSASGEAEVPRAERHVVVHRGHEQLVVRVLEDQAERAHGSAGSVSSGQRSVAHAHFAARRAEQPVEQQEQRRLAGAVRTDDPDRLAVADAERDAVERAGAVRVDVADSPRASVRWWLIGAPPGQPCRATASRRECEAAGRARTTLPRRRCPGGLVVTAGRCGSPR